MSDFLPGEPFLTGSFVTAAIGSSPSSPPSSPAIVAAAASASVSVPLFAFGVGVDFDVRVRLENVQLLGRPELAFTPEEIAPQSGVKCRLGNHDHHRFLSEQLAQSTEPLLRRLGDRDDDAPILDTSRQRLEALRILARHLGKRVRVEPDRGSLDVVERPLLREQAGDIVLGGKPAANHDLTETLAGATPFIERIVELHLREEPSLDQQLTQRDPNGSLGRIGSGQGLLTHSLILRCCDLSPNPPDICRRIEPQT